MVHGLHTDVHGSSTYRENKALLIGRCAFLILKQCLDSFDGVEPVRSKFVNRTGERFDTERTNKSQVNSIREIR